nr:ubiquitin-associated and SH3 domain-containing protein B-like [Quercus suber]
MAVPQVNKKLLDELEAMGFPRPRATRALHFSGNSSLEAAIEWVIDHENDSDIDQMPLLREHALMLISLSTFLKVLIRSPILGILADTRL